MEAVKLISNKNHNQSKVRQLSVKIIKGERLVGNQRFQLSSSRVLIHVYSLSLSTTTAKSIKKLIESLPWSPESLRTATHLSLRTPRELHHGVSLTRRDSDKRCLFCFINNFLDSIWYLTLCDCGRESYCSAILLGLLSFTYIVFIIGNC